MKISGVFVFALTLFVFAPNAVADISAEKYCELSIQDLKNRVETFKELTASYTANKDDQRALIQNEYNVKNRGQGYTLHK